MSAKSFTAFGFLVVSLDVLVFGTELSQIVARSRLNAAPQLKTLIAFLAVFIVGIGLIGLRRWAAIYFSVPLLCIGLWFFWISIEQVSFPWNLICMLEGVSLMLPAVVTIRLWPHLSWGSKWFF